MDTREWREYVRAFGILLAGLAVLFAAAMLSSAARRVFARQTPPDTEAAVESGMPEDPALAIYVWEKDGTESSAPVRLAYRTPVNTGPALEWNEQLLTWEPADTALYVNEVPIDFQYEGNIQVTISFAGYVCRPNIQCAYGKGEGYLLPSRRYTEVPAYEEMSAYNDLCVVYPAGFGFEHYGSRRVGVSGAAGSTVLHEDGCTYRPQTLAEHLSVEKESYRHVLHSEQRYQYRVSCYDTAEGTLRATAIVELYAVSGWQGAGNAYKASNAHLGEDGRPVVTGYDETLLAYAKVKPTWTVELVEYWQTEE